MKKHIPLLRRKHLEWLSCPQIFLHQLIAQRGWGSTLVYEPYLLEKSRWEIGKGCFPDHRYIGAALPSLGWFTCWIWKLPKVCWMSLWNGNFGLLVWTGYMLLSLIWKRRISHAKSGSSAKDIKFGVPFLEWKHRAQHQCSESKR